MRSFKNYKESWVKLSELASGGQGTTIKARSSLDLNVVAAVKILNRQRDEERRARMHRETIALSTLSHPNLPRVLDYNTHHYRNFNFNLFIATEFIEGSTLSEFDFLALTFEEKITLIKKICEVIDYCHKRGIIHRDIKPDNIILRNNSYDDPVILDFGISFNFTESDDDNLTPDGQHLGNRFLILPEQKIGEASKRDMRTDISCIIGLFYYILTNELPVVLIDEHERKPHQRSRARGIIDQLPKYIRDGVNNLFDVGFNQFIDKRWQSITSLIEQLEIIEKLRSPDFESTDNIIQYIQSLASQQSYIEARKLHNLTSEAYSKYNNLLIEVYKELGSDWGGFIRAPNSSKYSKEGFSEDGVITNGYLKVNVVANKKVFITGNELVIHSIMEGKSGSFSRVEVFREPLHGIRNWKTLQDALKSQFLNIVAQEIQNS